MSAFGSNDPIAQLEKQMARHQKTINKLTNEGWGDLTDAELKDKIRFLEMDSNNALSHIKDDELDFIFLDAYLSKEQAVQDLEAWYPKVKKGGLFSGHDYFSPMVYESVSEFRTKNNIDNLMSTYDNTFVWVK